MSPHIFSIHFPRFKVTKTCFCCVQKTTKRYIGIQQMLPERMMINDYVNPRDVFPKLKKKTKNTKIPRSMKVWKEVNMIKRWWTQEKPLELQEGGSKLGMTEGLGSDERPPPPSSGFGPGGERSHLGKRADEDGQDGGCWFLLEKEIIMWGKRYLGFLGNRKSIWNGCLGRTMRNQRWRGWLGSSIGQYIETSVVNLSYCKYNKDLKG